MKTPYERHQERFEAVRKRYEDSRARERRLRRSWAIRAIICFAIAAIALGVAILTA